MDNCDLFSIFSASMTLDDSSLKVEHFQLYVEAFIVKLAVRLQSNVFYERKLNPRSTLLYLRKSSSCLVSTIDIFVP